jgi:hypothetical protein
MSADKEFQRVRLFAANAADTHATKAVKVLGGDIDADGILNLRTLMTAMSAANVPGPAHRVSDAGEEAPAGDGTALLVAARMQVFTGDQSVGGGVFNAAASASSGAQGNEEAVGVTLVARKAVQSQVHAPVAATQATTTIAAVGVGVRRVLKSASFSLATAAGAASGVMRAQILLGATVVWEMIMQIPVSASDRIILPDLDIVSNDNEAIVVRFSAAPPAGAFQTVTAQWYTAQGN